MKLIAHLNLSGFQLLNTGLEGLAAAPASPGMYRIYFDTALGVARVWNGTVWVSLGGGGSTGAAATPTVIGAAETFTVAANTQVLVAEQITILAGGTLVIASGGVLRGIK